MKKYWQKFYEWQGGFSWKIKAPILTVLAVLFVGILGYIIILYGGGLIVKEDKMVLDAKTIVQTPEGNTIGEIYHKNRTLIDIEQVPEHVQQSFIAIEDRRFFEHGGIDLKSISRAIFKDIIARNKVEGASTITQQVVKNLFLTNDKTWMRKTKEAMAAIYLERHYSKKQILELYLNEAYFGQGVYGIETASEKYFSKPAKELTIAEGALLAGMVKGPNGYSPIAHPKKTLQRRNIVLKAMSDAGMISVKKRIREQGKTLGLRIQDNEERPWVDSYVDLVMKEAAAAHQLSLEELKRGGYRIIANMDETVQKIVYQAFQDDTYFPGNTADAQGAFVMNENGTGKIIAAVGGRKFTYGNLNRTTIKRQPGSTMKPIAVYGPALMTGAYQAYSLLPDQKMAIKGYTVANSDGRYDGYVSMYDAIVQSKNIAPVWLLNQIGIDDAKQYLKKMDISIPDKGLAIALGGLEDGLTPIQIANAYGTFANGGDFIPNTAISRIIDRDNQVIYQAKLHKKHVFSKQVAWDITKMLETTVQSGTARAGEFSKALAGKTGTTQHPLAKGKTKDAWFAGYTPRYTAALWMGYDLSDKQHYLEGGSSYPTALTKHILSEVDKQKDLAAAFERPKNTKDLPEPIHLPEIKHVTASVGLGGLSIFRGTLTWEGSDDDRIVYRIYQQTDSVPKKIGEVTGKTTYTVKGLDLLEEHGYFIVPYNPLTKMEGKRSEIIKMSI
ncbi:transglycosylase domain-containing protein [Virgibacillus sp. 179-BFC.A HS]|uniref:Transglycosylase domain-containing protein n=1 Tax=Tigheibacillus jepli TaxID=3035914 RepID=A0ABU5CIP3_9BACI|nr:transglycosylase domain-containing protein [Virgibacillus sp. 179-BFC.A HS]MDY0406222.1 transglycosylase domain-containing protein [Virgibacillus sp. 179-BFC.A HS]